MGGGGCSGGGGGRRGGGGGVKALKGATGFRVNPIILRRVPTSTTIRTTTTTIIDYNHKETCARQPLAEACGRALQTRNLG